MKTEEISPYSISIQNSPVISNTVSVESNVKQENITNFYEIKNAVLEMQGDISEIKEELDENPENSDVVVTQLERITRDLDCVSDMKTPEEVVKSGKLNKLKRFLMDFSDENSDLRKSLLGAKNVVTMIGSLVLKFNALAEKLGITSLLQS